MVQSQFGSCLYPHGAISLWEKDIMLSVFKAPCHAHHAYHALALPR